MPNKTFLRRPLRHIAVMGWSCWAWIVLTWRYTLFSLYITLTLTLPYITSITGPSRGHHHQLPMTPTSTGSPLATGTWLHVPKKLCTMISSSSMFLMDKVPKFPPETTCFVAVTHSVILEMSWFQRYWMPKRTHQHFTRKNCWKMIHFWWILLSIMCSS